MDIDLDRPPVSKTLTQDAANIATYRQYADDFPYQAVRANGDPDIAEWSRQSMGSFLLVSFNDVAVWGFETEQEYGRFVRAHPVQRGTIEHHYDPWPGLTAPVEDIANRY